MTLSSLTVTGASFAQISHEAADVFGQAPFDGTLGLGPAAAAVDKVSRAFAQSGRCASLHHRQARQTEVAGTHLESFGHLRMMRSPKNPQPRLVARCPQLMRHSGQNFQMLRM